jgi:putative flippase GtrA
MSLRRSIAQVPVDVARREADALAFAVLTLTKRGLSPASEHVNEAAMTDPQSSLGPRARVPALLRQRPMLVKAASFASIGVVNAGVNYLIFWLLLRMLDISPAFAGMVRSLAALCGCVSEENAGIIIANVIAWSVAVSGSYVMNSLITFAAESGRRLAWRAYAIFVASGLLGLIADTATLLIAKEFLPVMLAKLVAIGAGFVVNFSMSHFVVFRPRHDGTGTSAGR